MDNVCEKIPENINDYSSSSSFEVHEHACVAVGGHVMYHMLLKKIQKRNNL